VSELLENEVSQKTEDKGGVPQLLEKEVSYLLETEMSQLLRIKKVSELL
jgi:hypothetical protein